MQYQIHSGHHSDSSIIPVCTIDNPDRAVPLARTLQDCGIHIIEITLRTERAFTAAENVMNECPDMCVGLGTITTADQLQRANEIGAHFCVSPGMTERLVREAKQLEMPYLPGVSTVSEVMAARELGLNHLKFFPAEAAGGVRTLGIFRELFPIPCFALPAASMKTTMPITCAKTTYFASAGAGLRHGR